MLDWRHIFGRGDDSEDDENYVMSDNESDDPDYQPACETPKRRKSDGTNSQNSDAIPDSRVDLKKSWNEGTICHTNFYDTNQDYLILRRNEDVNFEFFLDQVDLSKFALEEVKLVLEYDDFGYTKGFSPSVSNKTRLICDIDVGADVKLNKNKNRFRAVVHSYEDQDKSLNLYVHLPANMIIGKYNMRLHVHPDLTKFGSAHVIHSPKPIYVLFNPYSEDDPTYIADEKERYEYIENETGQVYVGSSDNLGPRKWIFGQFEDPKIIDAALSFILRDERLVNRPFKNIPKMKSPVFVARILSASISKFCLIGNWSGKYEDGVSPSKWLGSVKIIQQAFETKKAVKYGQCWVFSGVTTTICRALGIGARSVTCFDSAHDTDSTMTIDKFKTEKGQPVDDLASDSIWNFHVWNELWMTRKDTKTEENYDGWQIIDATPQEESFGRFQCGPAPIKAIRQGKIDIGYEAGFIFGEVNADVCYWLVKKNYDKTYYIDQLASKVKSHCGKYISTKNVGNDGRHDLTLDYKFPEGSNEERAAFNLAYALGEGDDQFGKDMILEDSGLEARIWVNDLYNLGLGDDITLKLTISSKLKDRKIKYSGGLYTTHSIDRGDTSRKNLCTRHKSRGGPIEILAGEKYEVEVSCSAKEYFKKLEAGNGFVYSLVVQDVEANDVICMNDKKFILKQKEMMSLYIGAWVEK